MLHSQESELYEKAERGKMVGEGKRFSYIFADLALYHSREHAKLKETQKNREREEKTA